MSVSLRAATTSPTASSIAVTIPFNVFVNMFNNFDHTFFMWGNHFTTFNNFDHTFFFVLAKSFYYVQYFYSYPGRFDDICLARPYTALHTFFDKVSKHNTPFPISPRI